jgi:hypothetical protein
LSPLGEPARRLLLWVAADLEEKLRADAGEPCRILIDPVTAPWRFCSTRRHNKAKR